MVKMNEKPRSAQFWFQEIGFLLAGVDASWACLAGREWSSDGADEGRNQAQSHADLGGALRTPEFTPSSQNQEIIKHTFLAESDTVYLF